MNKTNFLLNLLFFIIVILPQNIFAGTPKISIITPEIGQTGSSFPGELAALWDPLTVDDQTIPQSVTLQIFDYPSQQLIDFVPPESEPGFLDQFQVISAEKEQLSRLKKIASALKDKNYKITAQYGKKTNSLSDEENEWRKSIINDFRKKLPVSNVMYFDPTADNDPNKLIFANAGNVRDYLEKEIIKTGMNQSDDKLTYLIIYKYNEMPPTLVSQGKPAEEKPVKEEKSLKVCNSEYGLNQGIQFISLSKSKSGAIEKKSDLNNAFKIFDTIAKESESAGQCCAKALMNRGIVRDMLGEPELALQDLTSAQQCDSQSWEAHYNLAAYHAKHKFPKPDLALQELDKTFSLGYKDCDQLLNDKDFKKLLRDREFNGKLKQLLHRYGLYCELPKPHV